MKLARYLGVVGVSIMLALPASAQMTSPSKTPGSATAAAPSTTGRAVTGGLLDINSASAEELDKLPGIGQPRAKAIIANRPYGGKDDLVNRKIIPQNVYNQIKDKIIARQGSSK